MHLILSSSILNFNHQLINFNFSYKYLNIDDLIKKIKKNYLHSCKILLFFNNQDLQIRSDLQNLLENYKSRVHIYFLNLDTFSLNKSTLFFLNEFLNTKLFLNDLNHYFSMNPSITIPDIYFNKIIQNNIIITGVCKNIEKFIFNTFYKFIYLSFYFNNAKIIIYENDSTDKTLNYLLNYAKQFQNLLPNISIIILSESNITGSLAQRISYARNFILNYILINKFHPDYIIQLDMDDVLIDFNCNSIIYPFEENIDWSMFGGNSKIYYDMWALRTLDNLNQDFWNGKKENNKYIMSKDKILESYFMISNESNPIPVASCFNGIGIYKYDHVINCSYNGDKTCEHVHFHLEMLKKYNAKLFIHPKLLVGPHKILGKPMNYYLLEDKQDFKLVKNNF